MANKTIITDAGMRLMSNSTASTGSQYWIGFYSLAYVPWKDGTVNEPNVDPSMTRLTTYGDEIYNVFQGDLTSDGFSGSDAKFGYTHYDGNLLRNYRYVRRADGRNALVTWVNSGKDSNSIAGAVVYSGATQTSDSSGNLVNVTSAIPLPAPLYYMNPDENSTSSADFVTDLLYPIVDTSVLSHLNTLTNSSGMHIALPMISTDFRTYAANGSVTDPMIHSSEFYSSPLTEDYAWYSSAATRTEDSDSTYSNQWNMYCDEFWKLQSISRYNRYHSPVNSNGIIVKYDTACRNMSKVTKYFPIDSYSVSGSKKVGDHEYATAIRLGIHLDISRSMTAADTENYFNLTQTGTSAILDMSGNDLFQSNSVSFKFNRIGVYAVPMRQVAYKASEDAISGKVEYQIDTDAEPVLFAVIDFDSVEIMSNDGDGNVTFEAELEVNLRAASDDSSIIRDTAVFYNRIEDDAGNWYKNQLIANASICEAVTQQGIALGHLAQTVGNSTSSQSGAGKCCNPSGNFMYASKNHTHRFLINFEDGEVVNDYGVRGRGTATEGKLISPVINPVQITSVTDTMNAAKTYSVYHGESLLWMTDGYDGDGHNPSDAHYYKYGATQSSYPSGWRLPSKSEFYALLDDIKTAYGLATRELALPYILSSDDWVGLTAYGRYLALKPNGYASISAGVYSVIGVGTSLSIETSDSEHPLITITYTDGVLSISESDFLVGNITSFYYTKVLVKQADVIPDLSGTYMLGKYSFCYGEETMCAGDLSTVSGTGNYVSTKCTRVDVYASSGTSVYNSYVGDAYWGSHYNSLKKTISTGVLVSGCDDCYFDTVGYSAFIGCRKTSAYDVETSLILGLGYDGLNPGSVRNIHSMIVTGDYFGNHVHNCAGGFVGGDDNLVSYVGRSAVLGQSNTLYSASDSIISGYENSASDCGYMVVSGLFNTVSYVGNSAVTGEKLLLSKIGDSLAFGYGNTYYQCGQSVLGGYYMYMDDPAVTGGIGSSLVLGGYVRVMRLESSLVSLGGYDLVSPMSSRYPVSGDAVGSDYLTFYTVSATPNTVGGLTYYPNPYGDDSGNYIRYIYDTAHSMLVGSSMSVHNSIAYVAVVGDSLHMHDAVSYCSIAASHSTLFNTVSYSAICGDALYIGNAVSYCMVSARYSDISEPNLDTYGIVSGSYIRMTSGAAYLFAQGSNLYVGNSSYYTAVFGEYNTVTNGSQYSFIFGHHNTVSNGSISNAVFGDYSNFGYSGSAYNFIIGSCDYLNGASGNSYVSVNGAVIGSYVSVPAHTGYSHLVVGTDWNMSGELNSTYGDAFLASGSNYGGGRVTTGTIQLGRGTENGGLVLGGSTAPVSGYVLGVVSAEGRLAKVDWVAGGSSEYLCQSVIAGPSSAYMIITKDNWSETTDYVSYVMKSSGYTPYSSDSSYVTISMGTYRVDWSLACTFACYVSSYSNIGTLVFYGDNRNVNGYAYGNSGSFIIHAATASNLSISAVSPGANGVFNGSSVLISKLS